jgi:hypothetical protein
MLLGKPPFWRAHNCAALAKVAMFLRYGLSSAIMFHSDDDISPFMPLLDIPEGFGSLIQRIASINNCFKLSCLNEFF